MDLDLFSELELLVRELAAREIEYALCGGLAMAVHGVTRATVDIDILIPPKLLEDALSTARARGFTIEAKPMTFADGAVRIHRASKADPESGDLLSVDHLVVTPPLEGVWESRRTVRWEAGRLSVVSRSGLIELKRLRASAQDLADIERLERNDA